MNSIYFRTKYPWSLCGRAYLAISAVFMLVILILMGVPGSMTGPWWFSVLKQLKVKEHIIVLDCLKSEMELACVKQTYWRLATFTKPRREIGCVFAFNVAAERQVYLKSPGWAAAAGGASAPDWLAASEEYSGSGAAPVRAACSEEPTARRANNRVSFPVPAPRAPPFANKPGSLWEEETRWRVGTVRLPETPPGSNVRREAGWEQKKQKKPSKPPTFVSVDQPEWMGDGLQYNSSSPAEAAWTPEWLAEETTGCESEIIPPPVPFVWGERRERGCGKREQTVSPIVQVVHLVVNVARWLVAVWSCCKSTCPFHPVTRP